MPREQSISSRTNTILSRYTISYLRVNIFIIIAPYILKVFANYESNLLRKEEHIPSYLKFVNTWMEKQKWHLAFQRKRNSFFETANQLRRLVAQIHHRSTKSVLWLTTNKKISYEVSTTSFYYFYLPLKYLLFKHINGWGEKKTSAKDNHIASLTFVIHKYNQGRKSRKKQPRCK